MLTRKEKKEYDKLPAMFRRRIDRMIQIIEKTISNNRVRTGFYSYKIDDTIIGHFDIFIPKMKSFHLTISWNAINDNWEFYCTSFCERISDRIVIVHGEYEDRITLFSFDEMLKETKQLLKWVQKA